MNALKTAVAAVGLALCVQAQGADAPKTDVAAGTMIKDETRVYVKQCINPETKARKSVEEGKVWLPAFLPPAVVLAAIDALVDVSVGIISTAAQDESLIVNSAFPVSKPFYKVKPSGQLVVNPEFQCLQVITGSFSGGALSDAPESAPLESDLDFKSIDPSIRAPRVFFEAEFMAVPGNDKLMALAPKLFLYLGPTKKRFWEWGETARNISINLTFQAAGAEKNDVVGNIIVPFRNVATGTGVGPDYFKGLMLPPVALPAMSATEQQALKDARDELVKIAELRKPSTIQEDIRLGKIYSEQLDAYCAAWDSYVFQLKEQHKASGVKTDFAAPANDNCPPSVRMAQLVASDRKANLDRVTATTDRTRELQTTIATSKFVHCNADACELSGEIARDYVPLVVSASITEIREASAFTKYLAAVAEAMKPSVKNALKDATPAAKASAEKAEADNVATSTENAQQDKDAYVAAKAKAEASYKAWEAKTTTSEKDAAWPQVIEDRVAANKAARKAKINQPYTLD